MESLGGFEGFGQYLIEEVGGIDGIKQLGLCCFQVVVAQCFDVEAVKGGIGGALDIFMSEIEIPATKLQIVRD